MQGNICLCQHCIQAIQSRGEKVIVLDSLYYQDIDNPKCEWCDQEVEAYQIYDCIIR